MTEHISEGAALTDAETGGGRAGGEHPWARVGTGVWASAPVSVAGTCTGACGVRVPAGREHLRRGRGVCGHTATGTCTFSSPPCPGLGLQHPYPHRRQAPRGPGQGVLPGGEKHQDNDRVTSPGHRDPAQGFPLDDLGSLSIEIIRRVSNPQLLKNENLRVHPVTNINITYIN